MKRKKIKIEKIHSGIPGLDKIFKGGLIKGSWVKKNAIVIDVGINPKDGRITGDVEFANARKRAAYITPVPGGVGPVTTIMLMKNLVELYKVQRKKR